MTLDYFLNIPTYDMDDMDPEEFDSLTLDRFNIKNYEQPDYAFKHFYVFKVYDPNSSTGYYGMALNKNYVEKIKGIYGKH